MIQSYITSQNHYNKSLEWTEGQNNDTISQARTQWHREVQVLGQNLRVEKWWSNDSNPLLADSKVPIIFLSSTLHCLSTKQLQLSQNSGQLVLSCLGLVMLAYSLTFQPSPLPSEGSRCIFGPKILEKSNALSPHYRDATWPSDVQRTGHKGLFHAEKEAFYDILTSIILIISHHIMLELSM